MLRWLGILCAGGVVVALVAVVLAWLSTDHFGAFGGSPDISRLRASPEFSGDKFVNPEATSLMEPRKWGGALRDWLFGKEMRAPICPLPIHWGTFVLAYHAWSEPPETLVELAAKLGPTGASVLTPRLGEPIEPTTTPPPTTTAWWRALPPIAAKCP